MCHYFKKNINTQTENEKLLILPESIVCLGRDINGVPSFSCSPGKTVVVVAVVIGVGPDHIVLHLHDNHFLAYIEGMVWDVDIADRQLLAGSNIGNLGISINDGLCGKNAGAKNLQKYKRA